MPSSKSMIALSVLCAVPASQAFFIPASGTIGGISSSVVAKIGSLFPANAQPIRIPAANIPAVLTPQVIASLLSAAGVTPTIAKLPLAAPTQAASMIASIPAVDPVAIASLIKTDLPKVFPGLEVLASVIADSFAPVPQPTASPINSSPDSLDSVVAPSSFSSPPPVMTARPEPVSVASSDSPQPSSMPDAIAPVIAINAQASIPTPSPSAAPTSHIVLASSVPVTKPTPIAAPLGAVLRKTVAIKPAGKNFVKVVKVAIAK